MSRRLPCVILGLFTVVPVSAADLVVLSEKNWDHFAPPGKEADCILGDYVLKSDRVWAVVAQPGLWRHANMTVRQVGGAVIDLTTTQRPNDQLSAFYPGMRRHLFERARIIKSTGQRVELELLAPHQPAVSFFHGLFKRPALPEVTLTYAVGDGLGLLAVGSVFKNPSDSPITFNLEDDLRADNFDRKAKNGVHELFWVQDRHFEQAYGVLVVGDHQIKSQSDLTRLSRLDYLPVGGGMPMAAAATNKVTLQPGGTYELVRYLIPGPHFFAIKHQALLRTTATPPLGFRCQVRDDDGKPVAGAEVRLERDEDDFDSGRTDAQGNIDVTVPLPGKYTVSARAVGRGSKTETFEVKGPGALVTEIVLPVAPQVIGEITDDQGRAIPCKVQFKGKNGTKNPDWGPPSAVEAISNLVYTANGKFTVPITPGEYEAIVSRGPEYDVVRVPLKVEKAAKLELKAKLKRSVRSPGWVSADFHSHASPSGDNTADQRGRVLNLLGEHVEYAPCTEHNRLDSYTPHLKALGADKLLGTCTGIELTGTPLPLNHQNAFPLKLKPRTQDNGAPVTDLDPEKQIRRIFEWDDVAEKLVQQNHPDIGWLFFDADGDGKPDDGYKNGFAMMHVIEVHPIHQILDMKPTRIVTTQQGRRELRNETIFNWLQLLNQGHRIPGVVNTDAHYNFHGSGWLRNWVRTDTETPGDIEALDIVRHSKKGHIVMSTGPYLEVRVVGATGGSPLPDAIPGDDVRLEKGKGTLHVRVQCPNWLDIDRVLVLVNGRPDPKLNFTRKDHAKMFGDGPVKFDQKIDLALEKDAHLIVVAIGEEFELGDVMGPQWGRMNPVAISNPIYADVDGNGFKANGDTLGAPLPMKPGQLITEPKP